MSHELGKQLIKKEIQKHYIFLKYFTKKTR